MSRETYTTLNTLQLVGFTDLRGHAWHYREDAQGDEPNHYPGAIPAADVVRRLFGWEPISAPLSTTIPADVLTMTGIDGEGNPVREITLPDRQAIVRPDTGTVLGVFRSGYQPHSYREWLLETVSTILGDTLQIGSAGLLRDGAVAYVSVEATANMTTPEGEVFRPHLLACTSLDGTVATTYKRVVTRVVCDNTLTVARGEHGQAYKVKHTRNSGFKLADARQAVGIVESLADDYAAEVKDLCETTVTDRQWYAFLDAYVPTRDPKGAPLTGRGLTMAEIKRDALSRLWTHDARVAPWAHTAWGVRQAVNTWTHHEQIVRGATRAERNMLGAIHGTTSATDDEALAVLAKALVS